jgi:hypothetical protein
MKRDSNTSNDQHLINCFTIYQNQFIQKRYTTKTACGLSRNKPIMTQGRNMIFHLPGVLGQALTDPPSNLIPSSKPPLFFQFLQM